MFLQRNWWGFFLAKSSCPEELLKFSCSGNMLLAVVIINHLRLNCKCKTFGRCCWWPSVTHHIATVHYKQEYDLMNGVMGKRCTRYFYYLCKYWIFLFIYFFHSITSLPRKYFLWRYFQNLLHLVLVCD